jgi:hypothetical protein
MSWNEGSVEFIQSKRGRRTVKMNISQAPFSTSLLGVIRGVADFLKIDLSTPALYGRSGHAFLVNIHDAVCPSGPYCWNINPFIALLDNCGILMKKHGFFTGESTAEERSVLETSLRDEIDRGNPCSILNMDHQIITGCDETGFLCAQPWECDYPPEHLSFGSWEEMRGEVHACFYSYEITTAPDSTFAAQKSLLYALDLNMNPFNHTRKPYTCGTNAYDVWIKGIEAGYGTGHGNWWNGTVWSECRKQGALYFGEIAEAYPACSETAFKLQVLFEKMGDALLKVSNKEEKPEEQIRCLTQTKLHEEEAIVLISDLAETIQS